MAAAPPPYSGPTGSGPGNPTGSGSGNYDPRWQRRAAKEQWRAQRAYYRGLRRPSLVRPLALIAIGLVALLIEAGTISGYAFWQWYVRWWPLLLIGLGVALLAEWGLERNQPYGRRGGVGGLVTLIVIAAVVGIASKHAMNSPFGWHFSDEGDNGDWSMHLFGQEHDADQQFDQAFGANGKLTIDNPRGDISIAPSTDDRIHVSAHKTVYTSNDRNAAKLLDRLEPSLTINGHDATLTTKSLDRGGVDLTVQVPAETSVNLKAGHGNVAVNGLNGSVGVDMGRGNVALNKITGACAAKMAGGDFSAHALTGDVTVSGRTEDASISDVTGRVSLDGDFMGDVNLAKLSAPLTFHSSRTTFQVDRLDGDLSLDSDDLTLNNAKGRVQASTRAKNITFTGIAGPLDVETSDGDISVELNGGNGPITLRNHNGAITLGLPADHRFQVNASTQDGDVKSDLDYSGSTQRSDHALTGDTGTGTGNGVPVNLVANHGDIEIKRASAEAPEPPEPPEPPSPPGAPGHARHLHLPKGQPAPQTTEQ